MHMRREIHIEWHGRESWRENGLRPPMPNTEAEKLWIKLDRPEPFEPAAGRTGCPAVCTHTARHAEQCLCS